MPRGWYSVSTHVHPLSGDTNAYALPCGVDDVPATADAMWIGDTGGNPLPGG